MHRRSQISIFKLLIGRQHPFQGCSKQIYPFSLRRLTSLPAQLGRNTQSSSNSRFLHVSSLNLHTFSYPLGPNLQTRFQNHQTRRGHSTTGSGGESLSELDVNKEVDMINLKFAEAREEIEAAMESKETVYFDEEAQCAREAVKEVLDRFEGLLAKLPESEKAALRRSMGLKIEQLKAELHQLED